MSRKGTNPTKKGLGMSGFKRKDAGLTNNFHANMVILLTVTVIYTLLTITGFNHPSLRILGGGLLARGATHGGIVASFVVSYFFTSYWFSPDLDLRRFRPGWHSFPLKPVIKLLSSKGKKIPLIGGVLSSAALFLTPLHTAVNAVWRLVWQPFAMLFTHRGAVHWPLIGTQYKIAYLYAIYWTLGTLARTTFGVPLPLVGDMGLTDGAFGKGGLYDWILGTPHATAAWVGMMVADVCHIAVDYWDSAKKGSRFVPPAPIAPRGLITNSLRFLRDRIK